MTTVTLLHPGAMGAAVGRELRTAGTRVLWVSAGRSEPTARRARDAGLEARATLEGALAESEVAISVCPPPAAQQQSEAVAATGFAGLYVEANAISPQRAVAIAAALPAARVVDGGIIGPPPSGPGTTRLYLSGDAAAAAAELFAPTAIAAPVLDGGIGAASALKIAYASYQKASRVLAAVAHALAAEHGVQAELLEEAELLRSRPLADTDVFAFAAAAAWRWAPELEDAAQALRDAGLPDGLAAGAAQALERWAPVRDTPGLALDELLALLRDPAPPH